MQQFTIKEHLQELKTRIFIVFISFILAFIVCYYFSESLYKLLLLPLSHLKTEPHKIIYTGLTEAFFTYLKLSAYCAVILIIPIIVYEIYAFIRPGLLPQEKLIAIILLSLSPFLFWGGGYFVYAYVMPKAWKFFLSFENKNIELPLVLEARISEYIDLVIQLIFAFGIAFQLPIMLIILSLLGLADSKFLMKKRRIAIVIIFIIAGILTPPDVLSQFTLAIPMLLLYEISIWACKYIEKRNYVGHKMD